MLLVQSESAWTTDLLRLAANMEFAKYIYVTDANKMSVVVIKYWRVIR